MPKYQIYSARIPLLVDRGVVVLTAFANPGGYPRGEWFLVIPDEKETVSGARLRFDVKSFDSSPLELNEDFMLEQALGQATARIQQYSIETYGKELIGKLDPASLIRPADLKLLVHLWVRGSGKNLKDVYQQSECNLFRDALRPILYLPRISTTTL